MNIGRVFYILTNVRGGSFELLCACVSNRGIKQQFFPVARLSAFKTWQQSLPPGFLLSVKAPRHLTHNKRLYAPERWMERIKACWHVLGDKRAVGLVQPSPNFAFDYEQRHYFLQQVPSWIRLSLEFRHPSWYNEQVFGLLEHYGAA